MHFISGPVLARPNFYKAFILDVDRSTKKVGVILSWKDGKKECVIAYTIK
jgi:hypothetical protein